MTYINIQTLIEVIRNNFALLPLWFIAWKHLKVKDKLSHLDLKSIMAFHWPKISNIYTICSKMTGLYWEPLWLKGLWPTMDK